MARIVRQEKRHRGFFGWVFLILFWGWNVLMVWWLVEAGGAMSQLAVPGDKYSQAGVAIGATLGVGMILFFWVAGDVILGLLALLTRGSKTTIVEETVGGGYSGGPGGGVGALPPGVDTSRWSKRDRETYERSQHAMPIVEGTARREPAPASGLQLPPVAASAPVKRGADELQPAVTALKVLANAGAGFDATALEAAMEYLEAENGGTPFARREASDIANWMQGLAADDAAIRAASLALPQSVRSRGAFLQAMTTIMGTTPTELQNRWFAALKRQSGIA